MMIRWPECYDCQMGLTQRTEIQTPNPRMQNPSIGWEGKTTIQDALATRQGSTKGVGGRRRRIGKGQNWQGKKKWGYLYLSSCPLFPTKLLFCSVSDISPIFYPPQETISLSFSPQRIRTQKELWLTTTMNVLDKKFNVFFLQRRSLPHLNSKYNHEIKWQGTRETTHTTHGKL